MEFQGWFETLADPGPGAGVEEDTGTEFTLVTSLTRDVFRNVPHYTEEGGTVGKFVFKLRKQAKNCNFNDLEVIGKCRSSALRRIVLGKDDPR